LAAEGYPGEPKKGDDIHLSDHIGQSLVFHAGTVKLNGVLKTNGGRVMAVTSLAPTLPEAIEQSLLAADAITWDGKYFRSDIGKDLLSL
jgi:phosphoribosylamine--glycine ligase